MKIRKYFIYLLSSIFLISISCKKLSIKEARKNYGGDYILHTIFKQSFDENGKAISSVRNENIRETVSLNYLEKAKEMPLLFTENLFNESALFNYFFTQKSFERKDNFYLLYWEADVEAKRILIWGKTAEGKKYYKLLNCSFEDNSMVWTYVINRELNETNKTSMKYMEILTFSKVSK